MRNILHRRDSLAETSHQGATNTPTNPTPVVPPTPDTMAVYAPGCSVAMIAGSARLFGWKPEAVISATSPGTVCVCQLSLVARTTWSDERTRLSVGFSSALVMPKGTSDGPATL